MLIAFIQLVFVLLVILILLYSFDYRNRRWQFKNDFGYDLDDHLEIRHPRYFCRGDDSQRRSVAVVPTKDSSIQECQCTKLPSQVSRSCNNITK